LALGEGKGRGGKGNVREGRDLTHPLSQIPGYATGGKGLTQGQQRPVKANKLQQRIRARVGAAGKAPEGDD